MEIIYEDKDLIVVYKKSGTAVQTSKISEKDLYTEVRNYLSDNAKKESGLWIIHRLDQPVKGIVVFAKNEKCAAQMSKMIQSKEVGKYYYAAVQGIMKENQGGKLINYIEKDARNSKAIIYNEEKGKNKAKSNKNVKRAELNYKVTEINEEKNYSVVEIELLTGRFHQIRAQMGHIGYPILMDEKYGYNNETDPEYQNSNDKGQIALCACRIEFSHPATHKKMTLTLLEKEPSKVDFLRKYE